MKTVGILHKNRDLGYYATLAKEKIYDNPYNIQAVPVLWGDVSVKALETIHKLDYLCIPEYFKCGRNITDHDECFYKVPVSDYITFIQIAASSNRDLKVAFGDSSYFSHDIIKSIGNYLTIGKY